MNEKPPPRRLPLVPQANRWLVASAFAGFVVVICVVVISLFSGGSGQRRPLVGIVSNSNGPVVIGSPTLASQPARVGASAPSRAGATPAGPVRAGGELLGCVSSPHLCGYPDATNTGASGQLEQVPGRVTSGPGWTWQTDHINVNRAGITLSGLDINGYIEIYGSNVTIRDVRITESGDIWGIGLRHANNVTIEDTEISSPAANGSSRLEVGIKDVYGDVTGTKVLRTDIWHTSTGIQISNGVIEDSYIHDFGYNSGDHLNGISVGGGDPLPLLVKHNTVLNDHDQSDAIALFQDFGTEENKTITGNLVAGGSYSIYGGAPGSGCTKYTNSAGCYGPSSDIVITGNRFSRLYFPNGGTFGWLSGWLGTGQGNVFSGNLWDNTGKQAVAQ